VLTAAAAATAAAETVFHLHSNVANVAIAPLFLQ
jgi:hypothetical protein